MAAELRVCGELERGRGRRPLSDDERLVRLPLEAEARRRGIANVSRWSTGALRIAVIAMRRQGSER